MPDLVRPPVNVLEAALGCAARGFNVIPIRADERKRPALAAWKPYRERRVTHEELQRWFDGRSCGFAAICGRASGGLTVVDIDDRELGERFLQANPGLLESTLCARTGGGNLHVYLRVPSPPAKFTLRRHDPPQPIDIQGEGSYVVMPPSLHASGRRYEWLEGCGPAVLRVQEFNLWFQSALARTGISWSPTARLASRGAASPNGDLAGTIIEALGKLTGEAGELRGSEVWFHCPFHGDKVMSLSANTERPVWHCLGCNEGGGIRRLRELQRDR